MLRVPLGGRRTGLAVARDCARLWFMPAQQLDPSWRKALAGARLLLSRRQLTRKRVVLGRSIGADPAVTPRLLDQAIACVCARRGLNYEQEMARSQVDAEP